MYQFIFQLDLEDVLFQVLYYQHWKFLFKKCILATWWALKKIFCFSVIY